MWKLTLLGRVSILGIVLIGLSAGCSTLDSIGKKNFPAETTAMGQDVYLVEMHKNGKQPIQYTGRINASSPNPTTVQTALEESGAINKYRSMQITVYRKVAGSAQSLKMPVTFDNGTNAVSVEQDYALHPSDRVVVKHNSSNPFGKVLGAFSGSSF